MNVPRNLAYSLAALIAVIAFFELTDVDLWLQDHLFDFTTPGLSKTARWVIDKDEPFTRKILHQWFKKLVIIGGVAALLGLIASYFKEALRPYRWRFAYLIVAFALVPVLVGGAKQFTNVYCPAQIERYGGDKLYVKVMERYPPDFKPKKKGKCFPAGHATSGSAFLALYFFFLTERARRMGLATGIFMGTFAGMFQMLRGEHFFSHTLVTMIASWIVVLLTYMAFCRFVPGFAIKSDASSPASARPSSAS